MNIENIPLLRTNKFENIRFTDTQGRYLPKGRAYFIPDFNRMRIKTVQVSVCSTFNAVKVIFISGTKKMISWTGNWGFKVSGSETILYFKKLNKPMKPSSVRKAFPPKLLINFIAAGSFPGTSNCQSSQ